MSVNFGAVYNRNFDIRDAVVIRQDYWQQGGTWSMKHPRPTDALVYWLEGEGYLEQSGGGFPVKSGDLIYIARDSQYSWHMGSGTAPVTMLFEFTLTDEKGEIIILGNGVNRLESGESGGYELLFERLYQEYSRPNVLWAAVKLRAYSLLVELIRKARKTVAGYEQITPGIRYLEDNVSQNKTIAELARMCNMSLSSFEKQFRDYSGMSPIEYRNDKRLDRAEAMLKNGTRSVAEIADALGYYDSAYFSRIFKKNRGMSPAAYRKEKKGDS